MICPGCSNVAPDEKRFCTKCGLDLGAHKQALHEKVRMEMKNAEALRAARPQEPQHNPRGDARAGAARHSNTSQPGGPQPARADAGAVSAKSTAAASFVRDVFAYPFRGPGPFILFFGTLLLFFGSLIPPFFSIALTVFVGGYTMLYYFEVINTSSSGKDVPPDWPDVSAWSDLISAFVMQVIIMACTVGPLYYYLYISMPKPDKLIIILLVLWAAIYYPMALIMAAETRNAVTLIPFIVLAGILRAPPTYYLVCLSMVLVFAPQLIMMVSGPVTGNATVDFFVLKIGFELSYFYMMIVISRIMGLFFKSVTNE